MRSMTRRLKHSLIAICVLVICTIAYLSISSAYPKCLSPPTDPGVRTVLYWTKIFGIDAIQSIGGPDVFHCHRNCVITSNRCLLTSAHSIVFHYWDISLFDLPAKDSGQQWIYYSMESPENTSPVQYLTSSIMGRKINAVMSYRRDSTVFVPYGRIERKAAPVIWKNVPLKGKRIAWFVSNCNTPSRREALVAELSKYLPVDVFGYCGTHTCPRGDDSCNLMLEREYAFYLAFENSLCKDYVTEKLFRTMQYNVIPVVVGPAENYASLPNNSVIHFNNFKSVRFLAKYLLRVANNESLYNSFLRWKSHFDVHILDNRETLCQPCHQTLTTRPDSWHDWWFDGGNCSSWTD